MIGRVVYCTCMIEQNIFDKMGKYQPEVGPSNKVQGLNILKNRLQVLFPELVFDQSLEQWIVSQENAGKLQLLTEDPSAFKRVYITNDNPDVVIKAFFGGGEKENWQKEKGQEDILKTFIEEFLPSSEYIEIEGASNPEAAYYQIQDRVRGVQLKSFVGAMLELLRAELSQDELENYFISNPKDWSVMKRKALKHFLPTETWARAVAEAKLLAQKLELLEEEYVVSDLDFFITPEGKIKIIDIQLDEKQDFTPNEEGFPEGLEDLKLIFNLK